MHFLIISSGITKLLVLQRESSPFSTQALILRSLSPVFLLVLVQGLPVTFQVEDDFPVQIQNSPSTVSLEPLCTEHGITLTSAAS